MKLKIRFFIENKRVVCEQQWELDKNRVVFLSSDALQQDLDHFIYPSGDYELVKKNDKNFYKINSSKFSYKIIPEFAQHVGSYRSLSLSMPFSSDSEFFLGDGGILLPYDENFNVNSSEKVQLEFINETDLEMFTTLLDETIEIQQLYLFLIYLTHVKENIYLGKSGKMDVSVVQSIRASELVNAQEVFNLIDQYHQYYLKELGPHKQKNLIFFQNLPDPNFQTLGKEKTFATGENVRNGVLIYLPNDGDYLEWLAGHRSYLREVKTGIIHELGHFYTSKGGDTGKTIISQSDRCPQRDYWLIGENLNGYFTKEIAHHFGVISKEEDFLRRAAASYEVYKERGGYAGDMYFCFVESVLKEDGTSLWEVFKVMVDNQRKTPQPYSSLSYFIDSCRPFCSESGIKKIEEIFNSRPEDFEWILPIEKQKKVS